MSGITSGSDVGPRDDARARARAAHLPRMWNFSESSSFSMSLRDWSSIAKFCPSPISLALPVLEAQPDGDLVALRELAAAAPGPRRPC